MNPIDTAIAAYVSKLDATVEPSDVERIRFEADPRGRKFTRIVRVIGRHDDGPDVSRSALCFVERATGKIWKADGWKGPALNFPRGSVYELPDALHRYAQFGF
jgi:hypothetical protein